MINKEYGNSKHSFSLADLKRIMVLIGQTFFHEEYKQNPKLILLNILDICIMPFVKQLVTSKGTPFSCFLALYSSE